MILNRGPHGPQGGIYKSWGGIQSIWGIGEEWTPSWGINKYPLIAQDVLLAGVLWRLHQCLLMLHYDPRVVAHYHRTQCPDQNGHWAYEGQHFWLRGIHTSDKNGNACITGTTNFKISLKIWLLMHMMPYTGKVPWPGP